MVSPPTSTAGSSPRSGADLVRIPLRLALRIAITGGLFLLLFRPSLFGLEVSFIPISLDALRAEISSLKGGRLWGWIGVALLLKAVGIAASIAKWVLLLRAQTIRLPIPSLTAIFLMGRFFGAFLPGTIGLDGFRLYEVARRTGRIVESTTVIVFDKLAGFIALTLLVTLTFPLGYQALVPQQRLPPGLLHSLFWGFGVTAGGALAFLCFPQALCPFLERAARSLPPRPGRLLGCVAASVSAYHGQRRTVFGALTCGFVSHVATSLMYFATAMALAIDEIGLAHVLFAAPVMIFGTVLGPSIGGEGIREAMFVYLLGPIAGPAKMFLSSHLGFWVEATFALLGGVVFLLSPRGLPRRVDGALTHLVGLPTAGSEPRGRSL